MNTKKLGRPPLPDKSIAIKIRWRNGDIETVRLAAQSTGEDVSKFIRNAALHEAHKKARTVIKEEG